MSAYFNMLLLHCEFTLKVVGNTGG